MNAKTLRFLNGRMESLLTLFVALGITALTPLRGWACCTVAVVDQPVRIASQEVLIVWDATTGTEHFIRRANFRTDQSETFGFLVPTPTQPDLAEVPDAVFEHLADLSGPEEVTRYNIHWSLFQALLFRRTARGTKGAEDYRSVRVVSSAHVAGYDAVVLEADDAGALTEWLGKHDFDSRPEITDWARPYIEAKWMITAFTYNPQPGETKPGTVSTAAVRMTFTSHSPIFPYRVPSDNRTGGSLLRLYYVGDERVSARLGSFEWKATTTFARKLGKPLSLALAGSLPEAGTLGGNYWLTTFEDETWPAGEDDLYFQPAVAQMSVTPPPNVRHKEMLVPLDVLLLLGTPAFLIMSRRRRTR